GVGRYVQVTDDGVMCYLHLLKQLAQLWRYLVAGIARLRVTPRRSASAEIGAEQGVFRQQFLAAGGAHVIEQGQQEQRQVAPSGLHPVQVDRHLQDRLQGRQSVV